MFAPGEISPGNVGRLVTTVCRSNRSNPLPDNEHIKRELVFGNPVYKTWINDYITQYSVGCLYSSMPRKLFSVHKSSRKKQVFTHAMGKQPTRVLCRSSKKNPLLTHWCLDKMVAILQTRVLKYFLDWYSLYFDSNVIKVCSSGSNWQIREHQ